LFCLSTNISYVSNLKINVVNEEDKVESRKDNLEAKVESRKHNLETMKSVAKLQLGETNTGEATLTIYY
jgi:hypothetical protein